MRGPHVCICHRNRLMSECLASALKNSEAIDCLAIKPEEIFNESEAAKGGHPPDLILLDATLDDALSIRIANHLRSVNPLCKLILLVPAHAIEQMLAFANLGAHGCLFEEAGLSEVRTAIETVNNGERYCSPRLASALVWQVGRGELSRGFPRQTGDDVLTAREREILELIAGSQLGNKQIARQLGLSLYTVKNHVHNIIEKLGVQDRHEAVKLAKRRGLLIGVATESSDGRAVRIPR